MTKREDWSLGAFLAGERNAHTPGGRKLLVAGLLATLAVGAIVVILAFITAPR